jgi:hypothetical protein
VEEIACFCVPDLASSIIAASNEPELLLAYLSPFLLKQQFVRGKTCALRVLNTSKC